MGNLVDNIHKILNKQNSIQNSSCEYEMMKDINNSISYMRNAEKSFLISFVLYNKQWKPSLSNNIEVRMKINHKGKFLFK